MNTELLNIIKDPKEYLESFTQVKSKEQGLIPFKLNPAQLDLFNAMRKHSRIIVLKARQIGISTAVAGYLYHSTITTPGITTVLIGYNADLAGEFLDKIKTFYRTTPEALRPQLRYNSRNEISFPALDSKILVLPSSENVGRGYTIFNCLVSELAFIDKADEKMLAIENAVPANGKIILESTPNGVGNLYHRMWSAKDNGYEKKKYGWWWHYCLDDETEVLTVNGWKKRNEFKQHERHFTINLKTRKIEIKRAINVSEFDFDDYMIHFKNQNLDMMVTPNHRCICENYYGYKGNKDWKGKLFLKKAEDIGTNNPIPLTTAGWHGIHSGKYRDAFVELIGWVVSEGTFEKYLISISQKPGEKLDRIARACDVLGYKYTISKANDGGVFRVRIHSQSTKDIKSVLSKSKELPLSFILDLTYSQMILLQQTLIDGDGWRREGSQYFAQKDKIVAENFQILSTLIGKSTVLSSVSQGKYRGYVVSIKKDERARRFSKEYKKYTGKVWCPTNGNGTLIIRRGGKVMLTGNSEKEIENIRRRINNPMRFAQEYELEFLASGRPVFPADLIKKLRKGILKVGDKVKDEDGAETTVTKDEDGFVSYYPPRPGRIYLLGADVAEGVTGGDYSVCTIFDRATGDEVAFWRGHIAPDRFGGMLNKWGRMYNNALAVVEINNHGLTTVTAMKNLLYPQMYFRPTTFDAVGTSWGDRLGWRTTKTTRPLMIDDLREALQDGSLKIHSESTLDEFLTFVFDDGGNMVSQSSFHDDCIFATAVGFQGFKVLYSGRLDQIDYEMILPQSSPY